MPQKVSFLFGSGISIPAGMPCVKQITEKVLSGIDVAHYTGGTYYFGPPPYAHAGIPDEYVPRVVKYLNRISIEIGQYYSSKRLGNYSERKINYEDLYYVTSQIGDSETGRYDNPIVQVFIDKILPGIRPVFMGQENEVGIGWQLREIAKEATHYLHDIVWRFLDKEPADLKHLHCVRDACQDARKSHLWTYLHSITIQ